MFRSAFQATGKSFGPIIISALSFILSFAILHPFALFLDPSFSLYALSGIGKLAVMTAGIMLALSFAAIQQRSLLHAFRDAATWPASLKHLKTFFRFAGTFAALHLLVLGGYWLTGWATFQPNELPQLFSRWPLILICCVGTFALAWAEELLFRGLIYHYFRQHYTVLPSAIIASFIFMLLHDLHNPLNLLTVRWQLGLGLFLLGLFLNLVMVWQRSIAAGAGVHAGLVIVKAILRKIHILPVLAGSLYWFPIDLRQSFFTHIMLFIGIVLVWRKIKKH